MSWTIYRLSDGEMIFDGWPGDDHPSETGFAFDFDTMGAVADASTQRALQGWSPTALEWSYSPQIARDKRWDAAKAYRALRQAEPVLIPDIVPGETIVADANPESRALIEGFARGAMSAIIAGTPELFSLTFTDHTNQQFTVDAMQTVEIGNYLLRQFTLCHAASQAVRALLDAALAAGATAEQINAIDITAGYPGDGAP